MTPQELNDRLTNIERNIATLTARLNAYDQAQTIMEQHLHDAMERMTEIRTLVLNVSGGDGGGGHGGQHE